MTARVQAVTKARLLGSWWVPYGLALQARPRELIALVGLAHRPLKTCLNNFRDFHLVRIA